MSFKQRKLSSILLSITLSIELLLLITYFPAIYALTLDFGLSDISKKDGLDMIKGFKGNSIHSKEFDTVSVSNNLTLLSYPGTNLHTIEVNCPAKTKVSGGGFQL